MTERTEIELNSMERRLNAIRMTDSERLVAMAAMRKGFIIVERFAWLAHKITQIGATLFSKPRLAKPSAYPAEDDRRFRSNVTTNSGALLIVDVQCDFLPGGAVAVPDGDAVVPVLNQYIALAQATGIPVIASRDWHPANHCSFTPQGGPLPPHCVAGSEGAQFARELELPAHANVIDKATTQAQDAYSAFSGTMLAQRLRARGVKRVVVGGLATDYCVLNTVRDALNEGFEVVVLTDAIRAANVNAGDGARAEAEMRERGAQPAVYAEMAA